MKLWLMCGLPGSGKSTLARRIASESGAVVISADDFFMVSGEYCFDPAKLPEAHEDCRRRVSTALREGNSVVVDNTSLRHVHRQVYVELAASVGVPCEVVFPDTPWRWDPAECARRTEHRVPVAEIERMLKEFEADAVRV